MAPGAFNVSKFTVDGRTLTMTEVRNMQGDIANPTTRKLIRLE